MDKIIPSKFKNIKDSFGYHKVRIYYGLSIIERMVELRLKSRNINRQDCIYLIGGLEGKGKSNLILWFADLYSEKTNNLVNIEQITRNVDELMNMLSKYKREAFLAMDEGAELSGDRYGERKSKDIKERFTVMRERCFFICMAFTNPLKMNTYFREDRVRGVFFLKRAGCAYYYANSEGNPHFANILNTWFKTNKTKSAMLLPSFAPDFIVYFPEYKGRLRAEYNKRKDQNIDRILTPNVDEEFQKLPIPDDVIKKSDVYKLLDMTQAQKGKLVQRGTLKLVRVNGVDYITRQSLRDYLNRKPRIDIDDNVKTLSNGADPEKK